MGGPHIILRNSENFKGIDKRSSDLQRTMEYATNVKNAAFRVSGAINKRKGFHSKSISDPNANSTASYGMFTYRDSSGSSFGATREKALRVSDKLTEIEDCSIKLTNNRTLGNVPAGEDDDVIVSHYLNKSTGTFVFKVTDLSGDNIYYELDLGSGKENNFISLEDFETDIEASSVNIAVDFSNSIGQVLASSDVADIPAAFMKITPEVIHNSQQYLYISFKRETDIEDSDNNTVKFPSFSVGNPYVTSSTSNYENASAVQLNNVMYISNGRDPVMKYDGTHIYRAGLPGLVETVIPGSWAYEIDVDQASGTGTGVITFADDTTGTTHIYTNNSEIYYKFVIEYTDAQGNLVQSQPSDPIKYTVGNQAANIDITWDDSIFAELNKNSNLKVQIYKTIANTSSTGLFYHVETVAWDNIAHGTVNYEDTTDINSTTPTEGLEFLRDPIKRRDPPPKGRYLTTFQNCLVISGQDTNVNNLQYSHAGGGTIGEIGSEYFPDDDNGVIVESSFGDRITAVATLRDLLYIFHKNSIHVLGGDITAAEGSPFSVELLTKEGGIGCIAFASMVEFKGQLLFLSESGMYSINAANNLTEISELVRPFFQDTSLTKSRSVAFNWVDQNLIIIHIPKEEIPLNGVAKIATNETLILAYDTYKDAWLRWEGVNFTGGITVLNNEVVFSSRNETSERYTGYEVATFSSTDTTYDYNDHEKAIEFEYETNWESLGDPTVPKKFLRVKMYAMDTDGSFESPGFDLTVAVQKDFFNFDLGQIPFDFGGGRDEVGWGADPWGIYPWGGPPSQFFKSKLPSGKSKCLKMVFSNSNLLENVLITNYELEIAAPFRQEIKD